LSDERRPSVGIFGIGLAAYWPQFDGLCERLEAYQGTIESRLQGLDADVVSAGLVDSPQRAREAGDLLAASRVDLLILYTATYATSSQVLPTVQAAGAPVLILNLQPTRSLDYEAMTTGEWLANCSACCVPEIAGAFARARIPFRTLTGTLLDGDPAWDGLAEWVDATRAVRSLRRSRLGFLGHTYPGMLDMYSDFTQVHAQTGAHVEVLEIDDLVERVESADAKAIARKGEEIRDVFDLADAGNDPIADVITPEIFDWSARVAVGLDRLVDDFDLDGLTYYYRGVGGNIAERVTAGLIVGNSLLTARGVPAAGEGDLKTGIAMLLLDRLGAGGSYTEFYALDFDQEFVLMGHDGPGHLAIADVWKVHHDSTDMADCPWMQREEEAFLNDPASVFGPSHDRLLREIRARIGLDYFGIDCGLDASGNLVVFEVNASMLVHDQNREFPYKAPFVGRIKSAFDGMLRRFASGSD